MFLVRHAETLSNRSGRFSGRIQEPIADDQWPLVEFTAKRLFTKEVERVYCSPLLRAQETATPLAALIGCEVEIMEEFNEIRMSPTWEGRLKAEVEVAEPEEYRLWRQAPHLLNMASQETLSDVQSRAVKAVEMIASLHPGQTCAVFTHEAVIRLLVLRALEVGPALYRHLRISHCGISLLTIEGSQWVISSVNEEVFQQ